MFRIVSVETSDHARQEFVVIRNHSYRFLNLKGWAITDETFYDGDPGEISRRIYVFREDLRVQPGGYVALCTGVGVNHWNRAENGAPVYIVYWNRPAPVWSPQCRLMLLQVATVAPRGALIHQRSQPAGARY